MKLFRFSALILAGGVSSVWAAADPQLLGLLMPDAKILAGVQMGQAKASPFGQFVLSQAGPNAQFDQLKAATGFARLGIAEDWSRVTARFNPHD